MKPKLLTTLKDYSWRLFLGDAVAGITVALVALPLSIAIAIASGATPKAGLITAILGGLLISLLGGSRVQIGGPTGAFIVVVAGVITQFGYDGLLLATLLAGAILVAAGLVRAGRFISLVPEPVIEGFTVGIALIIAVSQLKDLDARASTPLSRHSLAHGQRLNGCGVCRHEPRKRLSIATAKKRSRVRRRLESRAGKSQTNQARIAQQRFSWAIFRGNRPKVTDGRFSISLSSA